MTNSIERFIECNTKLLPNGEAAYVDYGDKRYFTFTTRTAVINEYYRWLNSTFRLPVFPFDRKRAVESYQKETTLLHTSILNMGGKVPEGYTDDDERYFGVELLHQDYSFFATLVRNFIPTYGRGYYRPAYGRGYENVVDHINTEEFRQYLKNRVSLAETSLTSSS